VAKLPGYTDIYIGNLSYQTQREDLIAYVQQLLGRELDTSLIFPDSEDPKERRLQKEYVTIIFDRDTGRSRGFGFMQIADEDAPALIEAMNGKDFQGRALRVNVARSRDE